LKTHRDPAAIAAENPAQIARSGAGLPAYEPHRTPDARTNSVAPDPAFHVSAATSAYVPIGARPQQRKAAFARALCAQQPLAAALREAESTPLT
jgi:hypothetical protein